LPQELLPTALLALFLEKLIWQTNFFGTGPRNQSRTEYRSHSSSKLAEKSELRLSQPNCQRTNQLLDKNWSFQSRLVIVSSLESASSGFGIISPEQSHQFARFQ
jgi:hypothetical protein